MILLVPTVNLAIFLALTTVTLLLFPTTASAQHEESTGMIKQVSLAHKGPTDDPRGLIETQIEDDQDLDLNNYTALETIKSPDKHTIIAQLDLSIQNGNTTLQPNPQINELMDLIDQAKENCWHITGFTSLDPYVFVLLEAFTC